MFFKNISKIFYKNNYRNYFEVTINLKEFKNKYDKTEVLVKPGKEKIAGRILSLRKMSKRFER